MTLRQVLGALLLASPFVWLLWTLKRDDGWEAVWFVVSRVAVLLAAILGGIFLLKGY